MSGKIKVLVVGPMKPCEVREIDGSLETMQAIVGGYIQAVYPFPFDEIALICNEEGKNLGLPYNRPLTSFGEPSRSPAKRVRLGEEEQGSERSFRRQAETEMSGLCDDSAPATRESSTATLAMRRRSCCPCRWSWPTG